MTVARAVWNRIEASDHRLMRRVNHWRPPRWFRLLMIAATRLGDGWLWCASGLVVQLFGGRERFHALGDGAAAAGLGVGLFMVLKRLSRRKRPCEIEPHCWSLVEAPDEFSFPSGHAITAFAVTIALGSFYPPLLWALLPVACAIALSRIVLGMHFPSDVLVGSSMGAALGYACAHLLLT